MDSGYTTIGTIIGTHALKGEVRIYSVTDSKEARYKVGNTLYIDHNNQLVPVEVKHHREHKGNDLILFEGYTSINDVEKFLKCKIYVHNSQIEELGDDEFYYSELIGCTVLNKKKELIGTVKDVVNYGASDIIVVENEAKEEFMIPFVNEFMEDVDLENRTIMINPIEGMLGE